MRRILALILCFFFFSTIAYAENAATGVQANATVAADGSCQVSISMTIRLESSVSGLTLPLGEDVSSVRLNGSLAGTTRSDGITSVKLNKLTKNVTGTIPINVTYTLNSVVTADEAGKQTITVPLLYGFAYPVEQMSFTVTMPNSFSTVPTFLSGYHEQDIESSIQSTVSGATVTGTVTEPLKDHETLLMTLTAPEGMFPPARAAGGSLVFDAVGMGICMGLALLYWLLTMSCWPRFPIRRSTAPDGVTAGTLGCYLVHGSADLTMMVLSWAQLGYLLIHVDENGRVLLHKKMEMGNERSAFENRTFKSLFVKGTMLDATGYRYARLCEKTAALSARQSWGTEKRSGNPRLLRILGCGVSLFAGIALGDSLTTSPAWRIILMILLGFLSALAGWYIQEGMYTLHLRGKLNLIISLSCCGLFLGLGAFALCFPYCLTAVITNLVIGLLSAYSARRTETGNRIRDEILGLRRYMRKVTKPELLRILRSNPDYYYELAPYALALDVDMQFAKRFGSVRQPNCTWLVNGMGSASTAMEFYPLLREAADAMNNLQKRPPWEKLLNLR